MQVDTLYIDTAELNALYYDGAGQLANDTQAVIRAFLATVEATEDRYNRAATAMARQSDMDERGAKAYKARIHVHFVVGPA